MIGEKLIMKFIRRIHDGVDGAKELVFRSTKGIGDFAKTYRPDHHEIEVAGGVFFTAGDGAKDERHADFVLQREQRLAEHFGGADGFGDDAAKFRINRACGVRLEIDVAIALFPKQDAGGSEARKLALDMANAQAGEGHDSAKIKRFVRVAVEQTQDRNLRFGEEGAGKRIGRHCTHIGYNCILFEYYNPANLCEKRPPEGGTPNIKPRNGSAYLLRSRSAGISVLPSGTAGKPAG
jgi:hypothetical protein